MSDLTKLTDLIEEKGKAVHALQKSLEQRDEDMKRLGTIHTETKSRTVRHRLANSTHPNNAKRFS